MSTPHWEPLDPDTRDTLHLVADVASPIGADAPALFLDACRRDAETHGGEVSVNRVRALLADADIPPRRYSSLWAAFTGHGKPMRKVTEGDRWEVCKGSKSGNDGKPQPTRRWVGAL